MKNLLITGGTGSFGRAAVEHILRTASDVEEIRIFSRDEAKQHLMRQSIDDPKVKYFIGDVRDRDSLVSAIDGVDAIFHAAALKQVPSCEFFPEEAIKTNVMGSSNVLEIAARMGVRSLVFLSTDKAVHPVNAMGMTKSLMEKLVRAFASKNKRSYLTASIVRYGNVMYSRGSVIPLFFEKLSKGEPLPVTERSMTRFMMSLSEAIDLVEFALRYGKPGDLLVRKAPAASVATLAKACSDIFSRECNFCDIGVRAGEKLHETLLSSEEHTRAEDLGEYFRIALDEKKLNYEQYYDKGRLMSKSDYRSDNTNQLSHDQVRALLLSVDEIRTDLVSKYNVKV